MNKLLFLFLNTFILFQAFPSFSNSFEEFLDALSFVESGVNDKVIGDGGRSIGRYQIGKLYFVDAQSFNPELAKYTWRDCVNVKVGRKVVKAYIQKYEPTAFRRQDWEIISKLHNGGPQWRNKPPKIKSRLEIYWRKIKLELDKGKYETSQKTIAR